MTIDEEERELILASIERLVQERIVPRAAEIDASTSFHPTCMRPRPSSGCWDCGSRRNTAAQVRTW